MYITDSTLLGSCASVGDLAMEGLVVAYDLPNKFDDHDHDCGDQDDKGLLGLHCLLP